MISVCIATYNGSKYIKSQLDSILSQLGPDDEVIISDSHSTDNTRDILYSYNDDRIKVYLFDSSGIEAGEWTGIMKIKASFLFAIENSAGDTIYLSDQDDIWTNNKVELCEYALKNYMLIYHNIIMVNDSMKILWKRVLQNRLSFFKTLYDNPFQGSCMAFRSSVKDLLLANKEEILETKLSHDHIIGYLVWKKLGKKAITPIHERLLLYRRHKDNVSADNLGRSRHSLSFKLLYRIYEIMFFLKS